MLTCRPKMMWRWIGCPMRSKMAGRASTTGASPAAPAWEAARESERGRRGPGASGRGGGCHGPRSRPRTATARSGPHRCSRHRRRHRHNDGLGAPRAPPLLWTRPRCVGSESGAAGCDAGWPVGRGALGMDSGHSRRAVWGTPRPQSRRRSPTRSCGSDSPALRAGRCLCAAPGQVPKGRPGARGSGTGGGRRARTPMSASSHASASSGYSMRTRRDC
mmetsp:Transcript_3523/g.9172  ORF Transcript_3523/g.9172 Transcript_3523/m.9172 type:complete len:218 (+) Transcript_3523:427-1080(+)